MGRRIGEWPNNRNGLIRTPIKQPTHSECLCQKARQLSDQSRQTEGSGGGALAPIGA